MISRRGFLAGLAVAFAADPERLLWVKSKTISIPAPPKPFDMFRIQEALDYFEVMRRTTPVLIYPRYILVGKSGIDSLEGGRIGMISRDVSVDRQAIPQRFCRAWLLPASRLPR